MWKAAASAGLIMLPALRMAVSGLLINGAAGAISKAQDAGSMMLILHCASHSRPVNGATELEVPGASRIGARQMPVWA